MISWRNIPRGRVGSVSYIDGADDISFRPDPASWLGIEYDPEGDGSVLTSLGTHEHWNNATDKQYSRNLGTCDGIELVTIFEAPTGIEVPDLAREFGIFPNPVTSSATVQFHLNQAAGITFEIYATDGKKITSVTGINLGAGDHHFDWIPENLHGLYLCKLSVHPVPCSGIRSKITAL
jgi:hypothetical protein